MNLTLILLVVFAFLYYQSTQNHKFKKGLGIFLLTVGVFFILPTPGLEDVIGLKIFSLIKGTSITIENLATFFVEYTYFSTLFGLTLIGTGLYILRWNYPKLRRFLK